MQGKNIPSCVFTAQAASSGADDYPDTQYKGNNSDSTISHRLGKPQNARAIPKGRESTVKRKQLEGQGWLAMLTTVSSPHESTH
jgi:hypothetical protein